MIIFYIMRYYRHIIRLFLLYTCCMFQILTMNMYYSHNSDMNASTMQAWVISPAYITGRVHSNIEEDATLGPLNWVHSNSLAVAETQGLERVKACLFESTHPSLLRESSVCVLRRGSAQGKQTLIKSHIAHAFTSSLLIRWNKFQCVQFN